MLVQAGRRFALTTLICAFIFLTVGSSQALAARGGGGGHRTPTPSGTLTLVLVDSTDGSAHWGQRITFSVSGPTEPHVNVNCSQGGVVVYGTTTGYFASYPWPWTQVMTLSSIDWSGGVADCVAVLWYASGTKMVTLNTLAFHVEP
jgi:hypothetical protein